jgi:hypothetical protein
MNLSQDNRSPDGGNSGGGAGNWGQQQAAPAHPMTVGAVGFGPSWTVEDSMAASIVRLEQDNQELRAANAVAEQERAILVREMQRLREQIADYRGKELTSMDDLRESCRDKEAADRAGGNPWSAW